MKNILFLIDTAGPGGAETLFVELTKYFNHTDYNALAVIHQSGWIENQLLENHINFIIIQGKGSFNFKLLYQLVRIIKKHEIDIIHAHLFGSNIYASLAGILTNTPVVSTFHGLVDISITERLLKQKIAIVKKGSHIVAVSDKILSYLVDSTSLTTNDILVIPNGIHLQDRLKVDTQEFRARFNLSESSTIIGCLGNVRPAKDYETAIKTIKILIESNHDVTLLIAGATNHELYDDYLKLIEKYNLKHCIQFIGFIDNPYNFLSNLDIYLMTSSSEGQPISLFQAMSCRLPIVGTRCGIEDVLQDSETAWLSPVKSHTSLAENIVSIINNPHESRRRASAANDYVTSHFDIKTMFEQYNNLYQQLTEKN